ncbi:MAG: pirin family protein [Chromatiales bacterium]|jgi:redox-sensitive bicupin YhaK (pirin superfamily)|nr:pirin family protein [Chromatiales bacterium]MDX9766929.1 pirin family protein [Ectothiorhodospiraceae bacterium]
MNEDILIRPAVEGAEGDGAVVKRLMPLRGFMNYDPFVLFDHFILEGGGGFPEHPHRGFEAITYLFEGSIAHADNLGNDSRVGVGGAQRFTAGRGIVHSEMPATDGPTSGIQLWINLPLRLKGIDPAYQGLDAADLPERPIEGGRERIIVGPGSPLALHTPVDYRDVHLDAGAAYAFAPASGRRGLVYVVDGAMNVNGRALRAGEAAFCDDVALAIEATQASRFMLAFGAPHGEPIRQYGPYVD